MGQIDLLSDLPGASPNPITSETCLSSASERSACASRRGIQRGPMQPATHTLGRTQWRRHILLGLRLRGRLAIALISLRGLRER